MLTALIRIDNARLLMYVRSMNTPKSKILEVGLEAAEVASKILLKYKGQLKNIREKNNEGLVSEADEACEEAIVSVIKNNFSDHKIIAEESHFKVGGELLSTEGTRWIIDPLDGTTNYIYGVPLYCTSIGVEVDGVMRAGVVHLPELQQTFFVEKGKGAYLKTKEQVASISVSSREAYSQALMATGFIAPDKKVLNQQIQRFSKMISGIRGFRRTGSAAYDLCLVAAGVIDIFWESGLKPWDVAAGSLLVEEAGGRVSQYNGESFAMDSKSILATNGFLHETAITKLKE